MALSGFASAQSWTHIGPVKTASSGNLYEPGAINCVMPDPRYNGTTNKIIYAGAVGGMWRSTDGASTWTIVPSNQNYFSGVGSIAIDPSGTPVYCSSLNGSELASYGSDGVYKYDPVTATWSTTGTFPGAPAIPGFTINHLKIHPANSQYIFAATNVGLYRSVNGGSSWSLVQSGYIENVDFIAATCPGYYNYRVYISGQGVFSMSVTDGASFNSVAAVTSPFSTYTTWDATLSATVDPAFPSTHIIYICAIVTKSGVAQNFTDCSWGPPANTAYALYKYTYNGTTETCTALTNFAPYNPANILLTVAGLGNVVYAAGENVVKYNLNSGYTGLYYPATSGSDVLVGAVSGCYPYGNPTHADIRDIEILPSQNLMFIGCDGGVYVDQYVPNSTGVFSNTTTEMNTGIGASQILGFSGSETDPDFYATGEFDTHNGYLWRGVESAGYSHGTFGQNETPAVMIDKFNSKRIIGRNTCYLDPNKGGNPGYSTSIDGQTFPTVFSSDFVAKPGNVYSADVNQPAQMSTDFDKNTFFQNPYRPDQLFYGGTGLLQYDVKSYAFATKHRSWGQAPNDNDVNHYHQYPGSTAFYAVANAMAFYPTDKNKVYYTTEGSTVFSLFPQLFQYRGPDDFDNSWIGHNEFDWNILTPDLKSLIDASLTDAELQAITFTGVAVSNWDPNWVWLSLNNVPRHPEVKILMYHNGVWAKTDANGNNLSAGIPLNEVVNCMVHEDFTQDGLYIGTNRGVYYRNTTPGFSSWIPYMTSLPHIQVIGIEINYHENTVRVGTYGNGIWKSPLFCAPPGPLVVNTSATTDQFYEAKTSVTIAPGVTMNNSHIRVRAGQYIELDPSSSQSVTLDYHANTTGGYAFLFIHGCDAPGSSVYRVAQVSDPTIESVKKKMGNEVVAFPNPFDKTFTIRRNSDEPAEVEVMDVMGRILFHMSNVTQSELQIDLSSEGRGMYLVRVKEGDNISLLRVLNQ
jgi:hypothetical protein